MTNDDIVIDIYNSEYRENKSNSSNRIVSFIKQALFDSIQKTEQQEEDNKEQSLKIGNIPDNTYRNTESSVNPIVITKYFESFDKDKINKESNSSFLFFQKFAENITNEQIKKIFNKQIEELKKINDVNEKQKHVALIIFFILQIGYSFEKSWELINLPLRWEEILELCSDIPLIEDIKKIKSSLEELISISDPKKKIEELQFLIEELEGFLTVSNEQKVWIEESLEKATTKYEKIADQLKNLDKNKNLEGVIKEFDNLNEEMKNKWFEKNCYEEWSDKIVNMQEQIKNISFEAENIQFLMESLKTQLIISTNQKPLIEIEKIQKVCEEYQEFENSKLIYSKNKKRKL